MTRSDAKSPVPVVCGIIERGGVILAARRGKRQSNGGLWEFPGGKVHGGETPGQALEREIREELDVAVVPGRRLRSSRHDYPWISIELIPFVCSLVEGEPRPREHDEIRWVTLAEAVQLSWSAADVPILEEYVRALKR